MAFNQHELDQYKAQYPSDPQVQALTLTEVNANTSGIAVNFEAVPQIEHYTVKRGVVTDCAISIGVVVFDTVLLAFGAAAVGKTAGKAVATAMAEAAAPAMSALEKIVARMAAPNATPWDKAYGFYKILDAIWDAGCFGAVLDAFLDSLSMWEAVGYGIVGVATIVAILATDGVALIAEIVLLLASIVSLVNDIISAVNTCQQIGNQVKPITDPVKPPTFAFVGGKFGGLKTLNGNFLTVVNGGGMFYGSSPIITDRNAIGPWEKFLPVLMDAKSGRFALRSVSRHFLTAVNGGGIHGANDAAGIIRSDATRMGDHEKLSFVEQPDGTFAIRTQRGYYISANNGGGMNPLINDAVMYTAQTAIGAWEQFTFAA